MQQQQTYTAKDGTVHGFPIEWTPEEVQAAADEIDGIKPRPLMSRPPAPRSDRELFAFNSPYAKETGLSSLQMLAASGKAIYGSDQSAADYLAQKGGGSVVRDEADGRPILVSPTGQRYNLNDPGFGGTDLSNIAGNIAAFQPAAKLTTGVAGLGGRIVTGAATSAATDAALQAGFTGSWDGQRLAYAAIGGGAGELLAPVLGGIYRSLKTANMSRQQLVNRGRLQIERMKASGQFDDATAESLGRELDQIAAGGDPNAMLSEAEFGFRYTRGQKTGNVRQLGDEERMRNTTGSRAGEVLTQNDQFNYGRAISSIDDLQQSIVGKPGRINMIDAVDNAATKIREQEALLKSRIGDAYTAAGQTKAHVGQQGQADLQRRIPKALEGLDIDANTPAAQRAV